MCPGGYDKRNIKIDNDYHTYIKFNNSNFNQGDIVNITVNEHIIGKYKIDHITQINNYYLYHFVGKVSYYKKYGIDSICDLKIIKKCRCCSICGKPGNKATHKHSDVEIIVYELVNNVVKICDKTNKKKTAKKDEDIRVEWVCENINNNTELGILMKQSYLKKFGLEILKVEKKGGNNIHYDILIYHTDGTTNKCEEKGTMKFTEEINEETLPYENSVQFSNIPCTKFTISKKYLKLWYDINVNNNGIKEKYNLPDIPDFENYLKGGPYIIWGDPKSEYSKTLKINYRGIYPERSMGGESKHNIDYRKAPNDAFTLTDDDKITLISEVQSLYDLAMNEKEVWLQTTGTFDGKFSFKWFNKIEPQKIIDVELLKEKDIKFKFILEDNSSIIGHLRWGNGCGFSCFRMDLK